MSKDGDFVVKVRGIGLDMSSEEVSALCLQFGPVVRAAVSTFEGRSIGQGFVVFLDEQGWQACLTAREVPFHNHTVEFEPSTLSDVESGGRMEEEKKYTVHVGNIPFDAGTEDITVVCGQFGAIVSARIMHRGADSLGYGFVEFESKDGWQSCVDAKTAPLNGRDLRFSAAQAHEKVEDNILVHDIGQLVTVDDLREHFRAFHVVDAKIVCRYETEQRKGFGFVKVASKGDRDAAIAALNHSRLGDRTIFVTEGRSSFELKGKRQFTRRNNKG